MVLDNRLDDKFDGIVIPVSKNSEYHTLNDHEKLDILNNQSYPTIQYCTMANGEVGMYLPKVKHFYFKGAARSRGQRMITQSAHDQLPFVLHML